MFKEYRKNLRESSFAPTLRALKFDMMRIRARCRTSRMYRKLVKDGRVSDKLHLGCGSRILAQWVNVDILGSDVDCDIASGRLPFENNQFVTIVSQHVIEHLEIKSQLIGLFFELRRVLQEGGKLYLSCPDIKKVCASYVDTAGESLLEDRLTRLPGWSMDGLPASHMINHLFHQDGEHKNLFDFKLLEHLLLKAGFSAVVEISEKDLLTMESDVPPRNDDHQTLYIIAS